MGVGGIILYCVAPDKLKKFITRLAALLPF